MQHSVDFIVEEAGKDEAMVGNEPGAEELAFRKLDGCNIIEIVGMQDIPFEIKRIFYIFGKGNVGTIRGKHSNRKSEFVLFSIKGHCKVKTIDENGHEDFYELSTPLQAVYLPKLIWKEMYDFSEDAVLMVLSSEWYDADEYIREFEDYKNIMRAEKGLTRE